ncbi:hypothetical protein BUALT_Bualt18G0002600 [Buddleja alternifolia]|uniref:Transmembrane protein n=1 Tax=Buddleja alternifolia TaxID=168488 RepID=A0AAV6W9Y5_9LAMI|nr:hypothetical protein BUALT_Bualt18G0002600 [Buddleja alternifolia]
MNVKKQMHHQYKVRLEVKGEYENRKLTPQLDYTRKREIELANGGRRRGGGVANRRRKAWQTILRMRSGESDREAFQRGGEGELKKGEKKKFITKEQEPEQYWQTAGEREGENPMKTPLPYIIIFGMSTPFVILAIAFANGWIKVPIR